MSPPVAHVSAVFAPLELVPMLVAARQGPAGAAPARRRRARRPARARADRQREEF